MFVFTMSNILAEASPNIVGIIIRTQSQRIAVRHLNSDIHAA